MSYRIVLDRIGDLETAEAIRGLLVQRLGQVATISELQEVTDGSKGTIVVHTDGGCLRGGVGAYAYVMEMPSGTQFEWCEAVMETTNNRMELMAAISALIKVRDLGYRVQVLSDSEYVVKGVGWMPGWIKKGWKTYTGTPVKNQDLWEELRPLLKEMDVEFKHVPGHSGVPGNERCDQLCTEAMQKAVKEML